MAVESSPQTWVEFIAASDGRAFRPISQANGNRLNRYCIDNIVPVVGQHANGLVPKWAMIRIESETVSRLAEALPAMNPIQVSVLRGVTQHLHYTSSQQKQELDTRARPELEPANDTVTVLIPIRKTARWWQQPQDKRQAHFQTTDGSRGHTAIGIDYVDRIYRKLYHSRYMNPRATYDFLTYFEFHRRHVDDFRLLLDELRDTQRNPEWASVESEFEIWMTKVG